MKQCIVQQSYKQAGVLIPVCSENQCDPLGGLTKRPKYNARNIRLHGFQFDSGLLLFIQISLEFSRSEFIIILVIHQTFPAAPPEPARSSHDHHP